MSEWLLLLDCPSCGFPCETMPPCAPTQDYPYPHWIDGDRGTCQCGAELYVWADEGVAYLVEAGDDNDDDCLETKR